MSQELSHSWNRVAEALHDIPVYPQRIRYALAIRPILDLPKTAAILEAGCGSGRVLRALAALGYQNLVGQDISHAALRETAQQGPAWARLVCSEDMPFAPGAFDAVTSPGVIEHVQNPRRWLGELARVARTGAPVVITSDSYMWKWLQRLGLYVTMQPLDAAIWPTTLIRWARDAGLELVKYGAFINAPEQRGYFFKQLPRLLPGVGKRYAQRVNRAYPPETLAEETRLILDALADIPNHTFRGLWPCIWSYETYFWFRKR